MLKPRDVLPSESAPEAPSTKLDDTYRRHALWLIAFLRRRFGGELAEDLAQEAFARTAAAQAEMRNPRAYLASVAMNAALEQVGQERRRREAAVPAWDAERAEADQEAALLLEQVILRLPPDLREVFLLSRFGGLTNVEIARRCNLSVKRVEARITKARAICTALMRD